MDSDPSRARHSPIGGARQRVTPGEPTRPVRWARHSLCRIARWRRRRNAGVADELGQAPNRLRAQCCRIPGNVGFTCLFDARHSAVQGRDQFLELTREFHQRHRWPPRAAVRRRQAFQTSMQPLSDAFFAGRSPLSKSDAFTGVHRSISVVSVRAVSSGGWHGRSRAAIIDGIGSALFTRAEFHRS
jgi:hypothetical protein